MRYGFFNSLLGARMSAKAVVAAMRATTPFDFALDGVRRDLLGNSAFDSGEKDDPRSVSARARGLVGRCVKQSLSSHMRTKPL